MSGVDLFCDAGGASFSRELCEWGKRLSAEFAVAIYSFNHSKISKKDQRWRYTAAAHVRYIVTSRTRSAVVAERMPVGLAGAREWLRAEEDADRANARMVDKLRIALPHELDAGQQIELVRAFAEEVTKGRAPWFAAFHTKGKAAGNHHCHMVVRDRDPDSGRRVIGLSERDSTEWLREVWERHVNRALAEAGCDVRIDRRTLKAQGVEREPGIHVGPRAEAMAERGVRAESRQKTVRNPPGAENRERVVDYPAIDSGRTRPERLAEIVDLNRERQRRTHEVDERARAARRAEIEQALGAWAAARRAPEGRGAEHRSSSPERPTARQEEWEAVDADRLARDWEQQEAIHGDEWRPAGTGDDGGSRGRQGAMGSLKTSLGYSVVFSRDANGELVAEDVLGFPNGGTLRDVPEDILEEARRRPRSLGQEERWRCVEAPRNAWLAEEVRDEVLFEQVRAVMKEREAAERRLEDERREEEHAAAWVAFWGGHDGSGTDSSQREGQQEKGSSKERTMHGERGRERAPAPKQQGRGSKQVARRNPSITIQMEDREGVMKVQVKRIGDMPWKEPELIPHDLWKEALDMPRTRFEHRVLTAARKLGKEDFREVEDMLFQERLTKVRLKRQEKEFRERLKAREEAERQDAQREKERERHEQERWLRAVTEDKELQRLRAAAAEFEALATDTGKMMDAEAIAHEQERARLEEERLRARQREQDRGR